MNRQQRILRASIAANSQWSREPDRTARTATARKAFMDRFENQVDPDRVHPPEIRAKMAEHARRAYFARLALASSRARGRRKGGGRRAAAAEK